MTSKRGRTRVRGEKAPAAQRISAGARWEGFEGIPILFANALFARLQDDQVIISFGRVELPYEVQYSEETLGKIRQEGVPVHTVARLAVTPGKLGEIIQHLTAVHNGWLSTQQQG